MGFEQYHEPAGELSAETRTFARMIASLTEEAEAIGWYAQRLALEPDAEAKAIMENAQQEEFKHFAMDLEFLIRRTPKWRAALEKVLFREGDIVEHGEEAEEAEAIGWYEQRLSLEKDPQAHAIMENAQQEEFKHFAMNLEFLARRNDKWRTVLQDVLFKEGDIVEHGEQAEDELDSET